MKLEIGDTVAYSAKFVRSIGGSSYGIAERRGTVTELNALGRDKYVRVLWEDEDESQTVNTENLAKPGPNLRFAEA